MIGLTENQVLQLLDEKHIKTDLAEAIAELIVKNNKAIHESIKNTILDVIRRELRN